MGMDLDKFKEVLARHRAKVIARTGNEEIGPSAIMRAGEMADFVTSMLDAGVVEPGVVLAREQETLNAVANDPSVVARFVPMLTALLVERGCDLNPFVGDHWYLIALANQHVLRCKHAPDLVADQGMYFLQASL